MHSRLLILAGIGAFGASLAACAADSTGPSSIAPGAVSLSFSATGASSTSWQNHQRIRPLQTRSSAS